MSLTADSIDAGVVSTCAHCRELAVNTMPAGERADALGVDPKERVCAVCAGAVDGEVAPPLPWHGCWEPEDAS